MSKIKLSIIAAIGMPGRVLGHSDGRLPWYLPEDFKHFKEITTGHPVIMGRKTWESIAKKTNSKGLLNRINIVISRNGEFRHSVQNIDNVYAVSNVQRAVDLAKLFAPDTSEIFIIGGGEIYRQVLPIVDYLYLTLVHGKFEGDVTFPEFADKFAEPETINLLEDEKTGIGFEFLEFKRPARKKSLV